MSFCRLCSSDSTKVKSHIISFLLIKRAKDIVIGKSSPTGSFIDFNKETVNNKAQDAFYEYGLLCLECEKKFNPYETYFARVLDKDFKDDLNKIDIYYIDVKYKEFKLFHLINLWRASVSSNDGFADFSLGKFHETKIAKMIETGDPGLDWEYPTCCIQLSLDGEFDKGFISPPIMYPKKFDGFRFVSQIYGGCLWHTFIGSHKLNEKYMQYCLKNGSVFPIIIERAEKSNLLKYLINGKYHLFNIK